MGSECVSSGAVPKKFYSTHSGLFAIVEIHSDQLFSSLDASDTTIMGAAREAVALFLRGREKAIRFYSLSHLKYIGAMAAGKAYSNSQDLVDKSTEEFRDILYNKESDRPREVSSSEDVKQLWEQVMGKPWPAAQSESEPKEETETIEDE